MPPPGLAAQRSYSATVGWRPRCQNRRSEARSYQSSGSNHVLMRNVCACPNWGRRHRTAHHHPGPWLQSVLFHQGGDHCSTGCLPEGHHRDVCWAWLPPHHGSKSGWGSALAQSAAGGYVNLAIHWSTVMQLDFRGSPSPKRRKRNHRMPEGRKPCVRWPPNQQPAAPKASPMKTPPASAAAAAAAAKGSSVASFRPRPTRTSTNNLAGGAKQGAPELQE